MTPFDDRQLTPTIDLMPPAEQRAMLEALGPYPRRADVVAYLRQWWLAHAPVEAMLGDDEPPDAA